MSASERASAQLEAQGGAPRRLRAVLCTRGGLFGAVVLSTLRSCERIELCGIVRSSRVFHPACGFVAGAWAYVRRSGIAYSLYLLTATSVADTLCRFGRIARVPTRTRELGIPVHTTRDLNAADGLSFLRARAPDVLISAFFDQRLNAATLGIPRHGGVNIHPSLLPSFKGVDPVLQARLRGVARIGVTVHYMTPELDCGTILAQRAFAPPAGSSIFAATARLFREGAQLLTAETDRIGRGDPGVPQPDPGDYQSWPSPREIRALRGTGTVLIRASDLAAITRM